MEIPRVPTDLLVADKPHPNQLVRLDRVPMSGTRSVTSTSLLGTPDKAIMESKGSGGTLIYLRPIYLEEPFLAASSRSFALAPLSTCSNA